MESTVGSCLTTEGADEPLAFVVRPLEGGRTNELTEATHPGLPVRFSSTGANGRTNGANGAETTTAARNHQIVLDLARPLEQGRRRGLATVLFRT
jgi:hypothetical protein